MTARSDRTAFKKRERALATDVRRLFTSFVEVFEEVRGVPEDERVAWLDLIDELVSLRVKAGHTDPTAFLEEIVVTEGMASVDPPFEALGPDDDESERWTRDITDAAEAARRLRPRAPSPVNAASTRPASRAARRAR